MKDALFSKFGGYNIQLPTNEMFASPCIVPTGLRQLFHIPARQNTEAELNIQRAEAANERNG